jgi:hypothetical protein
MPRAGVRGARPPAAAPLAPACSRSNTRRPRLELPRAPSVASFGRMVVVVADDSGAPTPLFSLGAPRGTLSNRLKALWHLGAVLVCLIGILQREHWKFEPAVGAVTVSLSPPPKCPAAAQKNSTHGYRCGGFQQQASKLPYCAVNEKGSADTVARQGTLRRQRLPCRYEDASHALADDNEIFAATRVTSEHQRLPGHCNVCLASNECIAGAPPTVPGVHSPIMGTTCAQWDEIKGGCRIPSEPLPEKLWDHGSDHATALPGPECYYDHSKIDPNADSYYVSQAEDFTAFIDHTLIVEATGRAYSWVDADLKFDGILDVNGKKLDPCDDYEAQHSLCPVDVKLGAGRRDVIPLRTLLRAAGINDLDTFGDSPCTATNGTVASESCIESARFAGIKLLVDIQYNNAHSWSASTIGYTYSVRHVPRQGYMVQKPWIPGAMASINLDGTNARMMNEVHGIHADFVQSGEVGGFNAHTAMVNLVSAVGVYAAMTSMVELAWHYCGCKARYRSCLGTNRDLNGLLDKQVSDDQRQAEMRWLRQQVEMLSQENVRLAAAVRRLDEGEGRAST